MAAAGVKVFKVFMDFRKLDTIVYSYTCSYRSTQRGLYAQRGKVAAAVFDKTNSSYTE